MAGGTTTTPFGDGAYIPDPLAQFLSRVLAWSVADPPDSFVTIHAFGGVRSTYHGGGRAFASMAEYGQLQNFVSWLNHNESDVFFCLSTQRHDGSTDSRGNRKVGKGGRGARNARWLKALVLDLDVKPTGYPSQRAALAALLPFCEQHGLDPLLVSSGRGIHAYFVLNTAVTLAQWQPLAGRLIAAAQTAGLKFDVAVTRNPATLLRLPTSFNRKDRDSPLECRVLAWGSPTMGEGLRDYPAVQRPVSSREQPTLDPAVFPPRPPINGADHEQVRADLDHARIVTSIDLLRAACPVVADSDERGGDGDLEPLWFELAKLCHYVEGGRDYFHALSEADSRYDEAATDRKYDTAEPQGWPACATIAAASPAAAKICEGCKFFGRGRSPIHFARAGAGQTNGTVNGHSHSFAAASTIEFPVLDLPEGYHQLPDHRIVTPDGKFLFNNPIMSIDLVSSSDGSGGLNEELHFIIPSGLKNDDQYVGVQTPCSTFGSSTAMAALMGKGMLWQNTTRVRESMTDIITRIREGRAAYKQARHGWVVKEGKLAGFAFGGTLFTPDGPQISPAKNHVWLTPTGTLDEWKFAANLWVGKGLIDHEILIATGVAAPLIYFTLVDGAIVFVRSNDTGYGKTAAIEAANSFWAHRQAIIRDGTSNATVERIGERNNMPGFYDDMVPAANKHGGLVLSISAGKGKDRLSRSSKWIEPRVSRTLLVATANASLVQAVSNNESNAHAARIFEIEMTDALRRVDVPDTDRLRARQSMEMNYGKAGMVVAEFLGRHHAAVQAMMTDVSARFKRNLNLGEEDRFWLATAATIYVGATIAKKLNLIAFDTAAMHQRLCELLRRQKSAMNDMRVDVSKPEVQLDRIGEFLNDHLNAIIRTDRKPSPGCKGAVILNTGIEFTSPREFVARIAVADKWMLVSEPKVRQWFKKKEYNPTTMKEVLVKAGYCFRSSNQKQLTAQTELKNKSANEYVLEFDLTNPANERFLPQ